MSTQFKASLGYTVMLSQKKSITGAHIIYLYKSFRLKKREHFWLCVLVYRQKPVFHDESTLTQTKKKKKMDPSENQKCLSINKVTFHTSNFSFIFVLPSSYCIFKAVERSLSSHYQLICQKFPNKYNGFPSSTRLIRNCLSW